MQARGIELYTRRPSALAFMARALRPSPGLEGSADLRRVAARWQALRIGRRAVEAFEREAGFARPGLGSVLLPHCAGFPLHMALLTRADYPFAIWGALQIRNSLAQHRPFDPGAAMDLEAGVDSWRQTDKGVEIDVATRLVQGSECCWESLVTYFYRDRRVADSIASESPRTAPDLAGARSVGRFRIPTGGRWRFARITGDYNGIHQWSWYARLLGFRDAFAHPQRTAGLCMAKLPPRTSDRQSLDLWIKGPAYYGAGGELRATHANDAVTFGLFVAGDPRPALVGTWRDE